MSRLSIETPGQAQTVLEGLYRDMGRRISASQPGLCPVDMSLNFLRLCHAHTCGKCVPCRVGLGQLAVLIEQVLDRTATLETIDLIESTAQVIADSADCAIGYEAARMVLKGVQGFREDYEEHVLHGRCICGLSRPVPCVSTCPAHVDIPGYVALVREGRYDEAVRIPMIGEIRSLNLSNSVAIAVYEGWRQFGFAEGEKRGALRSCKPCADSGRESKL